MPRARPPVRRRGADGAVAGGTARPRCRMRRTAASRTRATGVDGTSRRTPASRRGQRGGGAIRTRDTVACPGVTPRPTCGNASRPRRVSVCTARPSGTFAAVDERDVERRFERRAGRRLVVGAIVGTVMGAIAGLLVGMIVFRPWTGGDLAMALAGAILLGGIGGVWGGL